MKFQGFLFALSLLGLSHGNAYAVVCDNAEILSSKIIKDVPWDQLYPIKLAGVRVSPKGKILKGDVFLESIGAASSGGSGKEAGSIGDATSSSDGEMAEAGETVDAGDEESNDIELKGNSDGSPWGASSASICFCQDNKGITGPGMTNAMYEPQKLIELVRNPDCMLALGKDLDLTSDRMQGITANEDFDGNDLSLWHYHYYAFPVMQMIDMAFPNRCSGSKHVTMSTLAVSELDPTWYDDELSMFANPEGFFLSSIPAMAACIIDVVPANLGWPLDKLYWCAGSWGHLYPLTGWNNDETSLANRTSLLATKLISTQHRRGFAMKTFGDDALCRPKYYPHIPKNQYKMNMLYPLAEKDSAHKIGQSSLLWGEWRNKPTKEDAIYLLWGYTECCTLLTSFIPGG